MLKNIAIIGGGQAAIQAAISLRHQKFAGDIHIFSNESYPAYHRPPLSKSYILESLDDSKAYIKPIDFYKNANITLHLNSHITHIDRDNKIITDNDNQHYHYDKLIIATGTRPKTTSSILNVKDIAIPSLRGLDDAKYIKQRINEDNCQHIMIIGAGFIGLELAASAVKLQKKITIIEHADRILKRSIQPILSDILHDYHRNHGVDILLNSNIQHVTKHNDNTYQIRCDDKQHNADLLINATGVVTNSELAEKAGLPCHDNHHTGIIVDAYMRTLDHDIYAIGDVALHANPYARQITRLESVQNATDQAKIAAHNIVNHDMRPYDNVPWFWSDQGELKIQMAGICHQPQHSTIVGEVATKKYSIYHFEYDRFVAMDSINQPGHHLAGRKILEYKLPLQPEHIQKPDFNPRDFIKQYQI